MEYLNFSARRASRRTMDHLKRYTLAPGWSGVFSVCMLFGIPMLIVGIINLPGQNAKDVIVGSIILLAISALIFVSAFSKAFVEVMCQTTYEVRAPSKDSPGIVRIRKERPTEADQFTDHFFDRICSAQALPTGNGYFDVELELLEAKTNMVTLKINYSEKKLLLRDVENAEEFVENIPSMVMNYGTDSYPECERQTRGG